MAAALTFRMRIGRQWQPVPLSIFKGLPSREAWMLLDGEDCVAEFTVGGVRKGYVCGTQKWVDHYRKKGFNAYLFRDAVEWFELNCPGLLSAVCPPMVHDVERVFPGSELDSAKEVERGA